MGKATRGIKEFTREQRLSKENKQLKQELRHLRKQIARLDASQFETMKQMCNDYEDSERFQESIGEISSNIEEMRKQWACDLCKVGFLEITLYSKLGETHYFRSCNGSGCNNRTKGQRYDKTSVKGIIRNKD